MRRYANVGLGGSIADFSIGSHWSCILQCNVWIHLPLSALKDIIKLDFMTSLTEKEMVLLVMSREKAMATHSSVLAWRIPGTAESGELPSMGSHRFGHD